MEIGYQGQKNFDAGVIYAPYIPVMGKMGNLDLFFLAERMMVMYKKQKTEESKNSFIDKAIGNRFFRDMIMHQSPSPKIINKIRLWEILHGLPDRGRQK